jgi:preprotein translocase subunit SecE
MADNEKNTLRQDNRKKEVAKPKKKRFQPLRFFKEIISELKKVSWPSRQELIKRTGVVLAFVLLLTVIVGLMDSALSALFRLVFAS